MRSVSQNLNDAISRQSYAFHLTGTVEPTRVFFDTLSTVNAPAFADAVGMLDTPILQDIGVTSGSPLSTIFYNHSGSLKYQISSSSTVVDTGQGIWGKPGVFGNYIYFVNSSGVLNRYTIDWDAVRSLSSGVLGSASQLDSGYTSGSAVFAHGVTSGCVVMYEDNGGFRANYFKFNGGWTKYSQTNRFMSPHAVDYTSGSPSMEKSMWGLGTFSSALQIGDEVFAYLSNCSVGSVDGAVWSPISQTWSDLFTAVPSELSASMSEFRLANGFTAGSCGYLVGQFKRNDSATGYVPYTMILNSSDGRTFSMEPATLVNNSGYRLLATLSSNRLFVSGCNRHADALASYLYRGDPAPIGEAVALTEQKFKSYSDSSLVSGQIDPAVGDEYLMYHPFFAPGARVIINTGYSVPGGIESLVYGTYIHGGRKTNAKNGSRIMSPALYGLSDYRLSTMTSPFYTQIISKSSERDNCIDQHNLYTAPNCGGVENSFSVDFWDSSPYDDSANGITGQTILNKGGVQWWETTGAHKIGVKSRDIAYAIGTTDYPTVTSSTVHAKIYGWSKNDNGSVNDAIGMILFLTDKNTKITSTKVVAASKRFPNTYRDSAGGDLPIEYDITGLELDLQITNIGVYAQSSAGAKTNIARVDLTSGVLVYRQIDVQSWTLTSGSGMELPTTGAPNIMFASKPYQAYNFIVSASFRCNVTGYVASKPCGYGLVGLAEDGANYIAARYNLSNSKLEIVKARKRVTTVLASGDPASAIGQTCEMQFAHRDGHFSLRIRRNGIWTEELAYNWQDADGFMFENPSGIMHTGIYGTIELPYFYTTGLDLGSQESGTNSEAIPFTPGLPTSVLYNFPSSGRVTIDGIKYNYSGILVPEQIRGPWQFRNNGRGDEAAYAPPFGSGDPALECLDFDWNGSDGSFNNYVIGIDDGSNYICGGVKWRIWITTGGAVQWIRDRARYTAPGSLIGEMMHDLSNKVWMTGGLLNPSLYKGENTAHGNMSYVELSHEGSIWCTGFEGSSGDADVTVEDLVDRISRTCGAVARFPGDHLIPSAVLNSTYVLDTKTYSDGFDVRMVFPLLSGTNYINFISDTQIYGYDQTQTILRFTRTGAGTYRLSLIASTPEVVVNSYDFPLSDTAHLVRVLYHDNFITVYIDECWIYTFGFAEILDADDPTMSIPGIKYADSMQLALSSSDASATVTNIRVIELSDWREAVYIDLETNGKSAISSVIQERPVEIWNNPDGSVSYAYEPVRQTVTPDTFTMVHEHTWAEDFPTNAGSDAIIYFSEVKTYQFQDYARNYGLSTKVMRLPNLSTGAVKAAQIMLKKAFQQGIEHTISMRPDIRIQPGDIVHLVYNTPGTGTPWDVEFIVENINLSYSSMREPVMEVSGRENR